MELREGLTELYTACLLSATWNCMLVMLTQTVLYKDQTGHCNYALSIVQADVADQYILVHFSGKFHLESQHLGF